MTDLVALRAELDAGHPDTGAYNVDNALALSELHAINRPAESGVQEMTRYLATNKSRTNEGEDTTSTALLGRLQRVASAVPWTDVFRRGGVWVAGASAANNITLDATGNTITFGANHDISALNDNQAIELVGTLRDNGLHQIVSVVAQVVTVDDIQLDSTLERAACRVYWVRDNDLVTPQEVDAAKTIDGLLLSALETIDFSGTEMADIYALIEGSGVWKTADSTAMQAFSEGLQSRVVELGLGGTNLGDVIGARALP